MNDEFLHRLRKDPSPEFAARLKARLKQQARAGRSSILRMFVIGFVIGGSALAATYWAVKGTPSDDADPSVAGDSAPAPSPAVPTPFSTPTRDRPMASSGRRSRETESAPITASSASPRAVQPTPAESVEASLQNRWISAPALSSSFEQESDNTRTGSSEAPIKVVSPVIADALTRRIGEWSHLAVDIENQDSDAAFSRLCKSADAQQPDVVLATRRITKREIRSCSQSGVRNIAETKLGYFGIVLTAAKMTTLLKVTEKDVFLALAKQVPSAEDPTRLIDNPNVTWRQANPNLEPVNIMVFGPAPDSVLGRAVSVLILEAGCESYPWIKELKVSDPERHRRICHTIREDGAYVTAEEINVLVDQRLWAEPNAMALLGFRFFDSHRSKLIGSLLHDAEPTLENIVSGVYRASRTLLIYTNSDRASARPEVSRFYWGYPNVAVGREGLIPLTPLEDSARVRIVETLSGGG